MTRKHGTEPKPEKVKYLALFINSNFTMWCINFLHLLHQHLQLRSTRNSLQIPKHVIPRLSVVVPYVLHSHTILSLGEHSYGDPQSCNCNGLVGTSLPAPQHLSMGFNSQWNFGRKMQECPLLFKKCSILVFSFLKSGWLEISSRICSSFIPGRYFPLF